MLDWYGTPHLPNILTPHIAIRVARRMCTDGFDCTADDVQEVAQTGTLDGREALASRILQEFDEYGITADA